MSKTFKVLYSGAGIEQHPVYIEAEDYASFNFKLSLFLGGNVRLIGYAEVDPVTHQVTVPIFGAAH